MLNAKWSNWSGSVTSSPAEIRYPASIDEIIAIVRECRARGCGLRVVGAGHSFTALAWTDGVLVSLDRYTGLEQVDQATGQATVRAGTQIKLLGELLFARMGWRKLTWAISTCSRSPARSAPARTAAARGWAASRHR